MALDAAMLRVTAGELQNCLIGARVEKIYMPARDEILFLLRRPDGAVKLLLSARSGSARIHVTEESFENPSVPPPFCMLLRKHLSSGRMIGVRTVDGERIVFLDFDTLTEMGDRTTMTISAELMGRYSNVVLVSHAGMIVDALKHVDAEDPNKRRIMPGLSFTMPPTQGKLSFFSAASCEIVDAVCLSKKRLSEALLDTVAGIGPVVCREIVYRSCEDAEAQSISLGQQEALKKAIETVKEAIKGDGQTLSVVYDGERPVEYSFVALTQYGSTQTKHYETASKMLDSYYAQKDRTERARIRSFDLGKQVENLYERVVRRQAARLKEREDTHRAAEKKLYGELIHANLHALYKGMENAELVNYYTGKKVVISLDPTKTPIQNAQKYYKDYKKLTTAEAVLKKLLENGEAEITYLASVKYEITQAMTEDDFFNIRRELKGAGYLKNVKHKENKGRKRSTGMLLFQTAEGQVIRVGRNNASNEQLTFKLADKRDYWFHVKDAPGSHVVLSSGGVVPGSKAMTQAAMIAAYFSSQGTGEKVAVNYMPIKNLRKAPGDHCGMVLYDHYETAYVTPDAQAVHAMRMDPQE